MAWKFFGVWLLISIHLQLFIDFCQLCSGLRNHRRKSAILFCYLAVSESRHGEWQSLDRINKVLIDEHLDIKWEMSE